MTDRSELLEATLDSLPEGVGLLDDELHVVFWNRGAESITGNSARDLMAKPVPASLKPLLESRTVETSFDDPGPPEWGHGFLVHVRHRLGHEVAIMARHLTLRDRLGGRIGSVALFHPAEGMEALARGESGADNEIEASQEDMTERLETLCADLSAGGLTFGVLWVTVDQGLDLRRTHGAAACEAMCRKVERVLSQGLRPAEHMGRWGEFEYLVISHEPSAAMLADHAQLLAGLARTADFRWWGDRVSLTVSIGAAQARGRESLRELLDRAKAAMISSHAVGGNHVSLAAEGHPSCSPS